MVASTSSLSKREGDSFLVQGGLSRQARAPEPRRRQNGRSKGRQSCPVPSSCLDKVRDANAVSKKLINFQKQFKLITKKRNIGLKKLNKTLDFSAALLRLKDASGGNASSPVCEGNSTSAG